LANLKISGRKPKKNTSAAWARFHNITGVIRRYFLFLRQDKKLSGSGMTIGSAPYLGVSRVATS